MINENYKQMGVLVGPTHLILASIIIVVHIKQVTIVTCNDFSI